MPSKFRFLIIDSNPTRAAIVQRGLQEFDGAEIAIAKSNGRLHPVVGLWPVSLAPTLAERLELGFDRSVRGFLAGYRVAKVEFSAEPQDPFTNINNWDDLARAEQRATAA